MMFDGFNVQILNKTKSTKGILRKCAVDFLTIKPFFDTKYQLPKNLTGEDEVETTKNYTRAYVRLLIVPKNKWKPVVRSSLFIVQFFFPALRLLLFRTK